MVTILVHDALLRIQKAKLSETNILNPGKTVCMAVVMQVGKHNLGDTHTHTRTLLVPHTHSQ